MIKILDFTMILINMIKCYYPYLYSSRIMNMSSSKDVSDVSDVDSMKSSISDDEADQH